MLKVVSIIVVLIFIFCCAVDAVRNISFDFHMYLSLFGKDNMKNYLPFEFRLKKSLMVKQSHTRVSRLSNCDKMEEDIPDSDWMC